MAARPARLKRRGDFLRVARKGDKAARPGLVLQVAPQPRGAGPLPPQRVGLTVSRKVDKRAVVRNRARRRLRALADDYLPACAAEGYDYVLVGRRATAGRPYAALVKDLKGALKRLAVRRAPEAADAADGNTEGCAP